MTRYFMAAILICALSGCAADDADVAATDVSVLMTNGGSGPGQDGADADPDRMAAPSVYDPPDAVADPSLEARIFSLPGEPAENDHSSHVWTIFDVIPDTRTNSDLVGGPHAETMEPAAHRESPAPEMTAAPVPDMTVTPVPDMTPAPAPAMTAAPAAPQRGQAVAAISYQIQLGALPSKNSAEKEWMRIEMNHPDLLRNRIPSIVSAETNSEIGKVFRLRTGPIGKLEAARTLCREFKSRGQDCFVVKFNNPG